jgi:glycosyltransferase involved in cell wall biosynthesis
VGLCKGLSELGWEIHIVTTPSRFLKESAPDFPWAKIHVIRAKGKHNSLGYDFGFLKKAVGTIENLNSENPFDLIHGHAGYFSLAIIPVLIRRKTGIPALFSLYCPASLFPSKLPMDKCAIRLLSLGLDKTIAVTQNVKNSLTKCGIDERRIEMIPSCYDERVFDIKRLPTNNSRDRTVLFVGNISKTKGLDIFLSAAKSVLRMNPDVRFVVTLHEHREVIKDAKVIACHALGSSVEVLGVVENMAQLVAGVDVVAAPFRSTEGISDIPIIILEAMALGKPVVASNLAGIKEAVIDGKTGILMDLNNANELAIALNKLLNDPLLRKKMGKEAVSQVRKFSYSEIAPRLSDLYTRVVETC